MIIVLVLTTRTRVYTILVYRLDAILEYNNNKITILLENVITPHPHHHCRRRAILYEYNYNILYIIILLHI